MSSGAGANIVSRLLTASSNRENKGRLKRVCADVIPPLYGILQIVKDSSGLVGLPGLQTGVSGVLFLLEVAQKTAQNADDIEQLGQRIDGLRAMLQRSQQGKTLPAEVVSRLDHLSMTWTRVAEDLKKKPSRHPILRFVNYSKDGMLINDSIRAVSWSIENFMVETTLAIEFGLDEHIQMMKDTTAKIETKLDDGFQQLNAKLDLKDGRPPYAIRAQFHCRDQEECLEGTRTEILDHINGWVNSGLETSLTLQLGDVVTETTPDQGHIFWINGSAGTGKTTIAYTIAAACRKRSVLGASFFCSRDDAECSNPNLIFTTIAYQLGQFCPSFEVEMARALKLNPGIGYSSVPYQLEELIVQPLRAVREIFPPCIVVMDALDECKDDGATSIILASLSRHVAELSPLRILVTSRPEQNISTVFRSTQLAPLTQKLILHEVELTVVQNDIEHYLTSNLAQVRKAYNLGNSWPEAEDVHALALLSFGLFIFAATSIRFVQDKNYSDPRGQLADLVHNQNTSVEGPSSPYRHLDQLYTRVLLQAFPRLSSNLAQRLKMVLGTTVLLRDPLSPLSLEQLLNLKPGTVRETLAHLHSIIIVPESDTQMIRMLHPSFFDFVTNPTRCQDPRLVVNVETQHTLLTRVCLSTLKSLRRDICGIRLPSILNNEVEDLPMRIVEHIPSHLQYACRHWALHLSNAMMSDVLLNLLEEFCSKFLLFWLEACSLLGELHTALFSLDMAQKALRNARSGADILLRDCEQFTREFFPVISTSALQVYNSALLLTPRHTLLRETYRHELIFPMKLFNAPGETWDSCLWTVNAQGSLRSVVFSPDGSRLISGAKGGGLRLWDAISSVHLNTFQGHPQTIAAVAFSPDGKRVITASWDFTLRIWDAVIATHLKTLTGHDANVTSVAFSPDGKRIVSGSSDKTIRLWDSFSGVAIHTLSGHSSAVLSVVFSPDGKRIVSGSRDDSLRLWDSSSGSHIITLVGHSRPISSVVFTPDGQRIVSGSWDNTVRLWSAFGGEHLKTLNGHSNIVESVACSPDGTLIASASWDYTVRLWDALSGKHLNTFQGHSGIIECVTFSPDGKCIVSGSHDSTIRLWNAATPASLKPPSKELSPIRLLSLSPDGRRIVSGSVDHTLQLWDAINGSHLKMLIGHTSMIAAITFSLDSKRFVTASTDSSIRLWDTATGSPLQTLAGCTNIVQVVEFPANGKYLLSASHGGMQVWDGVTLKDQITVQFSRDMASASISPSGKLVAVGNFDGSVQLWDTADGRHLRTLTGHSRSVQSVAFSPDCKRFASAAARAGALDNSIRLWDPDSGMHLFTLIGHSDSITSLAFSPDSTRLLSGSTDHTFCLWDAISGARLGACSASPVAVTSTSNDPRLLQLSFPLADSMTPLPCVYHVDGEWLCSTNPKRRLCWVPVSCRPSCQSWNKDRIVLGTEDGRVIVFDLREAISYLDALT